MKKSLPKIFIFLLFIPLFLFAGIAVAENGDEEGGPFEKGTLYVEWPESPAGTAITEDSELQHLVKYLYEWGIAIGILAAFGSLVFAGFQYTSSAGNPTLRNEAMGRIQSAGIGLVLLLSSFLILETINPALTTLDPLDPRDIKHEVYRGHGEPLAEDDPPCDGVILFNQFDFEGSCVDIIIPRGETNVTHSGTGIREGHLDDEVYLNYIATEYGYEMDCLVNGNDDFSRSDILSAIPVYQSRKPPEEVGKDPYITISESTKELDESAMQQDQRYINIHQPPIEVDTEEYVRTMEELREDYTRWTGGNYWYKTHNCELRFYSGGSFWDRGSCNELIPPIVNSPSNRLTIDRGVDCIIVNRGIEIDDTEIDYDEEEGGIEVPDLKSL